jgi:hypothetical protein
MPAKPTPLEWLILRIIDFVPAWGNDYRLERFFAKTDVCFSFMEERNGLIQKNWLQVKDSKAQVKEYSITTEGKRLLAEGYRTSGIKDYVMEIEPTGFILGLLEKMDTNSSKASGE